MSIAPAKDAEHQAYQMEVCKSSMDCVAAVSCTKSDDADDLAEQMGCDTKEAAPEVGTGRQGKAGPKGGPSSLDLYRESFRSAKKSGKCDVCGKMVLNEGMYDGYPLGERVCRTCNNSKVLPAKVRELERDKLESHNSIDELAELYHLSETE